MQTLLYHLSTLAVLAVFAVLCLFPVYYLFVTAFKTEGEYLGNLFGPPLRPVAPAIQQKGHRRDRTQGQTDCDHDVHPGHKLLEGLAAADVVPADVAPHLFKAQNQPHDDAAKDPDRLEGPPPQPVFVTPTLLRISAGGSLPGPEAAEATWDRFPSYEQMLDSVVRSGQRFERGPFRILPRGDRPVAYQPWYAVDPHGRVTQPYVAVAESARAGAGRSFGAAWDNLLGEGAPLPPGFGPPTPLEEARRWMLRADSALHAGDWEGFGRAFGALRQALGAGSTGR